MRTYLVTYLITLNSFTVCCTNVTLHSNGTATVVEEIVKKLVMYQKSSESKNNHSVYSSINDYVTEDDTESETIMYRSEKGCNVSYEMISAYIYQFIFCKI